MCGQGYGGLLGKALGARKPFAIGFLAMRCCCRFLLVPFLGRNFFPTVDAGQITMHVRAPIGSRIEDTSAEFDRIAAARSSRSFRPRNELVTVVG